MYLRSSTPDEDWMAESEDEDEIFGSCGEQDTQSENGSEMDEVVKEAKTEHLPPIAMTLNTFPSTEPDVHFQVFSQSFHLHSVVLKQHSGFFRAFLESPEKKSWIDNSAEFPYKWVSLVEDDGAWAMVWDDPNEKIDSTKIPFERHNQLHAFNTLIDSLYGKNITLKSINHLLILTEMADYYDCLPIVGSSVEIALPKLSLWAYEIDSNAVEILDIAYKLQNKILWKECAIYLVGAWRTHLPLAENKRAFAVLKGLRQKLQYKVKVLYQRLALISSFPPADEVDSIFSAWDLSSHSRFVQKPIPKLCKKLLALYQYQLPAQEGKLPHLLAQMLENHLQLVKREELETGAGECQDRFLFIDMNAEEAEPWKYLKAWE